MGICSSSESTQVATAKLILLDGRMMEFTKPVKVGYVLLKNPMCFICNSDDMEFDEALSAISADEELQLGQIYFALPLRFLRQPLQAEEMAALAAKANSALMRSGGGGGSSRRRRVDPIVPGDKYRTRVASCDDTVGSGFGRRKERNADGGGGGGGSTSSRRRRECYAAELSTIEE